ncbi:MAG: DUF1211 domain-containing protein [Deltaproteobacteria bacterium]|nr:DUF1211 domain-containing protein [Deltaproteobacteria bacterium]
MNKKRLEAFSDGVIAIILTIMVLELKVPHGATWEALQPAWPVFLCYVLSYLYLAIYWNNHHHMLYAAERINGGILWANLHLLFWLSLIPFVTGWMGENNFAQLPTALYGLVLLMASLAYRLLQQAIIREHGRDSFLSRAVGWDWKGKLSPFFYIAAMGLSFVHPAIAGAIYFGVALIWLVPDRRIERALKAAQQAEAAAGRRSQGGSRS